MKGGIASGIVYPRAIVELSRHYRFRSIGGTSAGAIAAAVTAAAEYQRRRTGSRAGFEILEKLPEELGTEVEPGKSKLLSLFQPQPPMRRLFSVFIGALNRKKPSSRVEVYHLGIFEGLLACNIVCLIDSLTDRYPRRGMARSILDPLDHCTVVGRQMCLL